jgi:hypothetical protein
MTDKRNETAMTPAASSAMVRQDYGIDVGRVIAMRAAVEEVVREVLHEGEHYGVIPGTTKEGKKPKKSLLQPGAEVLCQVFRLRPQFEVVNRDERDDFLFREVTCRLYNSVTGELVGEASGSANTREDKYTAQTATKLCPLCGKPTIFRSKKENGGWYCWDKKGGCGANFAEEDKKLVDQTGAVSGDKVWNLHHTIVSMAQKRAYVKAVRNATATSDIFTDEDAPPDDEHGQPGATHTRTSGAKPATAPKAGAVDAQKLTAALVKMEIGMASDPSLPVEEQKENAKKARLAWANGHLMDSNQEPVNGFLELTPEQIKSLLAKAEAGQCPQGW